MAPNRLTQRLQPAALMYAGSSSRIGGPTGGFGHQRTASEAPRMSAAPVLEVNEADLASMRHSCEALASEDTFDSIDQSQPSSPPPHVPMFVSSSSATTSQSGGTQASVLPPPPVREEDKEKEDEDVFGTRL